MKCPTAILPSGGLLRVNEAFVIDPGRPINICALLTAVPRKGRGKSSDDLWACGIRAKWRSITPKGERIKSAKGSLSPRVKE